MNPVFGSSHLIMLVILHLFLIHLCAPFFFIIIFKFIKIKKIVIPLFLDNSSPSDTRTIISVTTYSYVQDTLLFLGLKQETK